MQRVTAAVLLAALLHACCVQAARNSQLHVHEEAAWVGADDQAARPDILDDRLKQMEVLHAEARIFRIKGFLTPEECDHIIALATPRLHRSQVVAAEKSDKAGGTVEEVADYRTSQGMFLARGEDEVVKAIEERIAAWSLLPVENGEGMQVLRYGEGNEYRAHWDWFFHADGITNGGNRAATVLTYLSDVEEGGETVFPLIPAPGGENVGMSECARKHLAVKPAKGDAVLFHSVSPSGAMERRSFHTACPVIKGVKWAMPKWIHVGRYAMPGSGETPMSYPQTVHRIPNAEQGGCTDKHANCDAWSMYGECDKNAGWMVGTVDEPGQCVKACGRCDVVEAFEAAQQRRQDAAVPSESVATS